MKRLPSPLGASTRLALPLIAAAVSTLTGCMHINEGMRYIKEDLAAPEPQSSNGALATSRAPATLAGEASTASLSASSTNKAAERTRLFQTPLPPVATRSATSSNDTGQTASAEQESAVALDQLPLPVFIETVYATILKRNLSMDPSIAQRKELVSLKTGRPLSAGALSDAARAVLKSYGLAVTEFEGLVRITPANGSTGYLPELLRGRAMPDVPASLRPVFFLAELDSVSPNNVASWLRTLFGQRVNIQEDLARQALLLSGQSDDVNAALEAIEVLDQPMMRGRVSARVAPLYWSADELARRLSEVLQAQGYSVGTSAGSQTPIVLLPIGPLNSVIVFAASDAVLNHTLRWATELDQPASGRGTAGYFTYAVKNLDAADLAKTLQDVMNPAGGASGSVRSRVVVNAPTNTLIIQGSPTEYQQWFGLLQELDRPARTALISITIAQVTLGDKEALGFDWVLQQFRLGGVTVSGLKTASGAVSKDSTLSAILTNKSGSIQATLGTLASNNRARILANPSVMARNGEQASIQVGQDVPILTQQQQAVGGTSTVPGGVVQPNIVSTIQYRNTGVILRVKPVIHAGGRIDIDVDQEVSSAVENTIGGTTSPVISSSKVSTKLSVTDGSTVLLGGLMREDTSNANSGVPLLKDIPLAGSLFKSSTLSKNRTELVMLITPYIVSNEFDAQAVTDAFRKQFRWDSSAPGQKLLPASQVQPTTTPPEATAPPTEAAETAPKPYVLPPPEVKPSHDLEPAKASQNVGKKRQTARDFPVESAVTPAARAASNNVTGQGSAGKPVPGTSKSEAPTPQGLGTGKPVEDPQILKELMDAVNRKR